MTKPAAPDFVHLFLPGRSLRTLLLLHGTGGDESDLIPIGQKLDPAANILSPRGKVLENGMPRFFRRLAEGVFDQEDLVRRTHELADFVQQAAAKYGFDLKKLVGVGYSNGANIAGSMLLIRPDTLSGASLLRPMVPLVPEVLPDLKGKKVLVAAGRYDPIIPAAEAERLVSLLRSAGADVEVSLEEAGHGLIAGTIETARRWLAA